MWTSGKVYGTQVGAEHSPDYRALAFGLPVPPSMAFESAQNVDITERVVIYDVLHSDSDSTYHYFMQEVTEWHSPGGRHPSKALTCGKPGRSFPDS